MTTTQELYNQIVTFAQNGQLIEFNAALNALTPTDASNMSAALVDQALRSISYNSTAGVINDQGAADATRHLMQVVGGHASSWAVGDAMANYAAHGQLAGLDAILDTINPTQASNMSTAHTDEALRSISYNSTAGVINDQGAADATRHLMQVVGGHASSWAVGDAITNYANYGKLAGLDAILDTMTATQASNMSATQADQALRSLASNLTAHVTDETATADVIAQFMKLVGGHVSTQAIGDVMPALGFGHAEALDAIVNNLTPTHISNLGTERVDFALQQISYAGVFGVETKAVAADSTYEFMGVLGSKATAWGMDTALQNFSSPANFDAIDAIVGNISTAQLGSLAAITKSGLTSIGVKLGTNGSETIRSWSAADKSIHGLDGNDSVYGYKGNTSLYGDDGNDLVYDGFGGNDTLYGGNGSDTLYGGTGADTFVFREGDTGKDSIISFSKTQGDKLDISDYLDNFNPLQDSINNFVSMKVANGSTTVSVDADGTGAGQAVDVVVLSNITNLTVDMLLTGGNLIV